MIHGEDATSCHTTNRGMGDMVVGIDNVAPIGRRRDRRLDGQIPYVDKCKHSRSMDVGFSADQQYAKRPGLHPRADGRVFSAGVRMLVGGAYVVVELRSV
jgi:hypothetical protein